MDITKLKPEKLSSCAKEKIIKDFFPSFADEEFLGMQDLDDRSATIHAGALCLYATTLITKIHETNPMDLEPYCTERVQKLKELVKNKPKYANLSEDQLNSFVDELIIKDIRNCFAHGNFEISYDIYTKKTNFVLYPRRQDFETEEPIVISKNSLINANKKFLQQQGQRLSLYSPQRLKNEVSNNLNSVLQSIMLPSQMMKFAEYYLSSKPQSKTGVLFNGKEFPLVQYVLLATKITYEQDDYYNIFGKDSNIFDTISLVRNSIAHNSLEFGSLAKQVSYTDRQRSLTEPIQASATKLFIVDSQKEIIKRIQEKNSPESIKALSEKFKEIFNFFFVENNIEDIANVPTEKE